MAKYGFENFTTEIIDKCLTETEANLLEEQYIKEYNSRDRKIGYNILQGGNALRGENHPAFGCKRAHTDETKAKMAAARLGVVPWNKGKKLTDAHRANVSANHADLSGDNAPGAKFSNDQAKQLRYEFASWQGTQAAFIRLKVEELNVAKSTVWKIIHNWTYQNI